MQIIIVSASNKCASTNSGYYARSLPARILFSSIYRLYYDCRISKNFYFRYLIFRFDCKGIALAMPSSIYTYWANVSVAALPRARSGRFIGDLCIEGLVFEMEK